MIIPFEKMREDSRVWIFQSSDLIVNDKKEELIYDIEFFLKDWTSHGNEIESLLHPLVHCHTQMW